MDDNAFIIAFITFWLGLIIGCFWMHIARLIGEKEKKAQMEEDDDPASWTFLK